MTSSGQTLFPQNQARAMSKTTTLVLSVQPKLLQSAGRVLQQVDMNTSDAVTLFLQQVARQGGLPFDVRAANVKTQPAPRAAENPGKWFRPKMPPKSGEELWREMESWPRHEWKQRAEALNLRAKMAPWLYK